MSELISYVSIIKKLLLKSKYLFNSKKLNFLLLIGLFLTILKNKLFVLINFFSTPNKNNLYFFFLNNLANIITLFKCPNLLYY